MADGRASTVLTSRPVMNRISSMAAKSVGSLMATSSTEPVQANGSRRRFFKSGKGNRPKAASSTSAGLRFTSSSPKRSATNAMTRPSSATPS